MPELRQLEQLLTFDRCGTLSAAAQELYISQPALSRSMSRLEEELGVSLFDRSKNKIELNDNGRLAVECARRIIYDMEDMARQLHAYDRSKRTISIGSCAPAPMWQLTPIIAGIHPELTLTTELTSLDNVLAGLRAGIYHMIIIPHPIEEDEIISFKLCREHLLLSLPPTHPLAANKSVSFNDLTGETMLLLTEIGFWRDVCNRLLPHTHFIMQSDRASFDSLVRVSALPSFSSNLATNKGEKEYRVLLPISDKEANPTFYIGINKKDKRRFELIIRAIEERAINP